MVREGVWTVKRIHLILKCLEENPLLENMPYIEDFMTKEAVSTDAGDSCLEAAKLMVRMNIGAIVVSDGDRPVGIVTERDFLNKVTASGKDPSKTALREIMSSPPVTISPKATVRDAARMMIEKGVRRLVVVENDKLVGIVSIRDITRILVGSMAAWKEARVTLE